MTIVVTSLYGLEIVLRTVAYGTRRLLADGYFLLDLVVVVASVLGLSLGGVWRFLIVVRAVRLLRVIARLRAVRVMLYSLRKTAWRLMVGPFIVLILFWFIFSIIGMRLFSGTLSYCEGDPTILSRLDCENAIGPNGTIRALAWVQVRLRGAGVDFFLFFFIFFLFVVFRTLTGRLCPRISAALTFLPPANFLPRFLSFVSLPAADTL